MNINSCLILKVPGQKSAAARGTPTINQIRFADICPVMLQLQGFKVLLVLFFSPSFTFTATIRHLC